MYLCLCEQNTGLRCWPVPLHALHFCSNSLCIRAYTCRRNHFQDLGPFTGVIWSGKKSWCHPYESYCLVGDSMSSLIPLLKNAINIDNPQHIGMPASHLWCGPMASLLAIQDRWSAIFSVSFSLNWSACSSVTSKDSYMVRKLTDESLIQIQYIVHIEPIDVYSI